MMRANLLPRAKERLDLGGLDIEVAYVRGAFLGLLVVTVVVVLGVGLELVRLSRLDAAAFEQERRIAADAPLRARSKALALEVARYQNFANESQAYRRSGTDAAIALARIGNGVPERVWIDSVEHLNEGGYTIVGGTRSIDLLGGAIVSLGRALPRTRASIVTIDTRQNDGTVHFTARVAVPETTDSRTAGPTRVGAMR